MNDEDTYTALFVLLQQRPHSGMDATIAELQQRRLLVVHQRPDGRHVYRLTTAGLAFMQQYEKDARKGRVG